MHGRTDNNNLTILVIANCAITHRATDDSVTMAVDVVVLFITGELLFSCTVAVDVGIILSDDVFMLDSVILLATALDEDWFNAISIKVTIKFMVAI